MKKTVTPDAGSQINSSKLPLVSFYLGLGSIIALILSVVIAVTFEVVGAISLFRSLVLPLSAAAVIVGLIARKQVAENDQKNRQKAALGIIFGGVTFGLVIFVIIAVMLLFLPLLFVGR